MNFRGGIYVSQVYASGIHNAIYEWAKNIDINEVKYIGRSCKIELIKLMREEEPILLSGMDSVWCISGSLKTGHFIANVVMS